MNLFFTRDIDGERLRLPEEEARHAVQVLRLRPGDALLATDGQGRFFEAVVEKADKKGLEARIQLVREGEGRRDFNVHLAVAPTKNINRYEWFLEKATEIGVDRITPLHCARSERTRLRSDRLERVLLAAAKQSLKAYLPVLDPPAPFAEWLTRAERLPAQRFIAYIDPDVTETLKHNYSPGADVCILIGPEGDFSPEEVALARATGFRPVSLGPSRLRTETAALVACHTIHLLNQ